MQKILGMALAALLSAGAAEAQDWDAGVEAYRRGDYAVALKEWQPLAEAGDEYAQVLLALMYYNGIGVPQDAAEAARLYRLAGDQDHSEAQFALGQMYDQGKGVPQDRVEAARWYRLAADKGLAKAQHNLGVMYQNGEGVPEDKAEAIRLYRLAADQGNGRAHAQLGARYFLGEGLVQDPVAAHMHLNIGCALGEEFGCELRDGISKNMLPADISEAQRRARVCMESDYKDCD
jgi:TPR repeat protein